MATSFTLSELGRGEREEVAARLTSVLVKIQQLLAKDEKLSKMMQYQVKERGANDKSRVEKVLQFQGPDPDTLALLRDHHDGWLQNPASFWVRPLPLMVNPTNAQEEILCCYLQTIRDDAWSRIMRRSLCILLVEFRALYGSTPVAEIASILYRAGTVRYSLEELNNNNDFDDRLRVTVQKH